VIRRLVACLAVATIAACSSDHTIVPPPVTPPVTPPQVPIASVVIAGQESTCVLTTTGTAYCWGSDSLGTLGRDSLDTLAHPTPAAVAGNKTFTALDGSGTFVCGLTAAGQLWCWGSTLSYTTPVFNQLLVPTAVAGAPVFTSISASAGGGCGLTVCGPTTQGAAYCWGFQGDEQLGDPSAQGILIPNFGTNYYAIPYPVPVSGGLSFRAISVGFSHACAITTAGAVYCWGQNNRGQLGTGTTTASDVPVRIKGFGPS
jgi:alpha-tubulin suppressor-like RCC1 family protein